MLTNDMPQRVMARLRDRVARLTHAAKAARLLGREKAAAVAERELRIAKDELRRIEATETRTEAAGTAA